MVQKVRSFTSRLACRTVVKRNGSKCSECTLLAELKFSNFFSAQEALMGRQLKLSTLTLHP